jgi:methylase of polypeptide subunit release factors
VPESLTDRPVETLAFGGLQIAFDGTVLRPRPWTVEQSRWAATLAADAPPGPALELCCGAGHIGLAFARLADRALVMVDANPSAGRFAGANAETAGLGRRVDVRVGDLRCVLSASERFGFALADPPYLPSSQTSLYPEDPLAAVDGGADGLRLVRACLQVLDRHLAEGGGAVLQLRDVDQAEAVRARLHRDPATRLSVAGVRDVAGNGALVHLLAR